MEEFQPITKEYLQIFQDLRRKYFELLMSITPFSSLENLAIFHYEDQKVCMIFRDLDIRLQIRSEEFKEALRDRIKELEEQVSKSA